MSLPAIDIEATPQKPTRKSGKPLTPSEIALIAARRAQGESLSEIARTSGMDRGTVTKYANKAEVKEIVEQAQATLARRAYQPAVENFIKAVEEYAEIKGTEADVMQRREHGFKASQQVLQSMGILPTHSQATLVQQAFTQNNIFVSPVIDEVLGDLDYAVVEELDD